LERRFFCIYCGEKEASEMDICVETLGIQYGTTWGVRDIAFEVPRGQVTAIIGPNGSGKSTVIKAMGRLLRPQEGHIYVRGKDIQTMDTRLVAQQIAILPQVKHVPSDVTVERLVSYGRHPHLKWVRQLTEKDHNAIDQALEKTGTLGLKNRLVSTLSGGERQRAWLAMTLAQEPKILLLDEPTTFLDISYQLEILEQIKALNEKMCITVVMVLHDLNLAARYADALVVLKGGAVYDCGTPEQVLNERLFKDVFRITGDFQRDVIHDCPYFIPQKVTTA
jgi:iron complex transport system ATP-binding protein